MKRDPISTTRARLLLDFPWFGSLAMRLRIEPSIETKRLDVDGTTLSYNPEYMATLSEAQREGLLAIKTLQCALGHPERRGKRDATRFNQASGQLCALIAHKAGLQLPADVQIEERWDGMSVEGVYQAMQSEEPDPEQAGDEPGDGQGDSGGECPTGDVLDEPGDGEGDGDAPGTGSGNAPADKPQKMTANDWRIAAQQSNGVCAKAGTLPGDAARAVKEARESRERWQETLREYVDHTVPSDYSWKRPNRRFISSGVYLPGVIKENTGAIVWISDTSGSMSQRLLNIAWAELVACVREARPEKVLYYTCDTSAYLVGEWTPDDIPDTPPVHPGGGGTYFQPAFDAIAQLDEMPAACLYFTDLECGDTPTEPDYPVLWITGVHVNYPAPDFGRVVRIDLND